MASYMQLGFFPFAHFPLSFLPRTLHLIYENFPPVLALPSSLWCNMGHPIRHACFNITILMCIFMRFFIYSALTVA